MISGFFLTYIRPYDGIVKPLENLQDDAMAPH
ncbi:hypothetical protein DESC_610109 [Desulfosarcina cetonica]|nr:hypothetical protein DESC_610109 [Desulfosarcina cetonica]